jgi:hypothetical protein
MCGGLPARFSAPPVAEILTCMTCMLLLVSTASPTCSGTPSSRFADTNELLHERGLGEFMFAFRSPCVDTHDEVEEDVIILARLPYGVNECRLSTLDWGSRPARDSRNENVPDRNANTDCERRRASRRCISLTLGRSVEEVMVVAAGKSVSEAYSCSPGPMDAPLRDWDICPCQPFSPNRVPSAADFSRWCEIKVARSSTLEDSEGESGMATGDSYGEFVSVAVRSRRTESGANGSLGSGSG